MTSPVILVAEKNDAVRDAICRWMSRMFPQSEVVHARTGREAVRYAGTLAPTIALLDIGLHDMSARVTKQFIEAMSPSTEVVLFSPELASESVPPRPSDPGMPSQPALAPYIPSAEDVFLN